MDTEVPHQGPQGPTFPAPGPSWGQPILPSALTFFFLLSLWHVEVPGLGTEPEPQQ